MMKLADQMLHGFMNLLFPKECAVCRLRLDVYSTLDLCSDCFDRINYLQQPLCRTCGMELAGEADRDHLCGECLRIPPAFSMARSLVRYESAVQRLLQRMKYAGDTSVVGGISSIIRGSDLSLFADCQWIIPVPLHADRHRRRRLNQATILAGLFFPQQRTSIRSDWLIRTKSTTPQTGLGGLERRKNLAGAFKIRADNELQGTVICLVDDVFTTGTTATVCTRELLHHGVRAVKVLTLARVAVPQCGRIR